MAETGKGIEGVDWHWGPDPAFGFMTTHIGPRERCTGPDCEPESCSRCEGSMVEPGSEDYDPAVHMHNPTTGEPCHACNGTGKAPESTPPAPSPMSTATEASDGANEPEEARE